MQNWRLTTQADFPAIALTACAFAAAQNVAVAGEEAAAPAFTIIDADAYIPATREITQFEVLNADTILLRTGINRWYAAELSGSCGRAARFEHAIGIDTPGGGRIDRFATLIVDGRRCAIQSLSRIERLPAPEAGEAPNETSGESAGAGTEPARQHP
jgi:hypothetical protein